VFGYHEKLKINEELKSKKSRQNLRNSAIHHNYASLLKFANDTSL